MPLDNNHVTIASRVMLRVYPVFAGGVGGAMLLTPLERLRATPSLAFADGLIGLRYWGAGFVAIAAVLVLALWLRRRAGYQIALAVMVLWMATYTAMTLAAAIDGEATWSGWLWPGFVTCACWASLLSLTSRET